MFGPDRFHPSGAATAACAAAMLPTVANAIGVLPDDGHEPEAFRGEGVFALPEPPWWPPQHSGSEVSEIGLPGPAGRRPRRRALLMRRRRRHLIPRRSTR